MARICELTGKRPMKGSIIWRSGKSKKSGGIGTHVTAITKRRYMPNLQRVKAVMPNGEVRYVRVTAAALKKGLVTNTDPPGGEKADKGSTVNLVISAGPEAKTIPSVKGQTASSSYKPAVLDSGVRVMVPPHIASGTRIVVDVYEKTYVKRAD